jgi:hypothetical protein
MGQNMSAIKKINYDDIKLIYANPKAFVLINTLPENEQSCLLRGTILPNQEIELMNNLLKINKRNVKIVVYGKNCNDETVFKKYNLLISLGFYNVFIYGGGLFEWLMLQDIFGFENFPTTKKELDFIKYKPPSVLLNNGLIEYP